MRNKKSTRIPVAIIAMLAAAVVLLLGGTVGAARAADPAIQSAQYTGEISMQNIGVKLIENDNEVDGTLLGALVGEEGLVVGKHYTNEALKVQNSGAIPAYARLTIYRYWLNPDGEKDTSLSPELIALDIDETNWKVDEDLTTDERIVLYYPRILEPGETTPEAALTGLTVSGDVAKTVRQEKETNGNYTKITTIYVYDGYQVGLKAEADVVQTHSAEQAIEAAWGTEASKVTG